VVVALLAAVESGMVASWKLNTEVAREPLQHSNCETSYTAFRKNMYLYVCCSGENSWRSEVAAKSPTADNNSWSSGHKSSTPLSLGPSFFHTPPITVSHHLHATRLAMKQLQQVHPQDLDRSP